MMPNDPLSRYELAKCLLSEALRQAALNWRAKQAQRSQPSLSALLLYSASRLLLALSLRLKALAEQQLATPL